MIAEQGKNLKQAPCLSRCVPRYLVSDERLAIILRRQIITMAEDADADRMNIRLLVNTKTGKILYAEAGKEFVDLLFSFLLLPTGTVIKLLSENDVASLDGCIKNLYNSVDRLQSVFMSGDKSHLLQPKIASGSPSNMLRIQSAPTTHYVCSHINYGGGPHYVSSARGQSCTCGCRTEIEVRMADPCSSQGESSATTGGGYVKETVTFIISDDLSITPASTITSITLLNKLHVKDLTELDERNIAVGFDEALHLLRASLVSATALNDVFGNRLDS